MVDNITNQNIINHSFGKPQSGKHRGRKKTVSRELGQPLSISRFTAAKKQKQTLDKQLQRIASTENVTYVHRNYDSLNRSRFS